MRGTIWQSNAGAAGRLRLSSTIVCVCVLQAWWHVNVPVIQPQDLACGGQSGNPMRAPRGVAVSQAPSATLVNAGRRMDLCVCVLTEAMPVNGLGRHET